MSRSALIRIVAVLLLLIAGVEAGICDVSDACLAPPTAQTTQDGGCDQPLGDNCLCCCNHIVPEAPFHAEMLGVVMEPIAPEPRVLTASIPLPIEHPPQL